MSNNQIKILLLAILVVLSFGCSKEVESVVSERSTNGLCFEASLTDSLYQDQNSKTALSSSGKVSWNAGDIITINGTSKYITRQNGAKVVFEPYAGNEQVPSTFIEPQAPYDAYYACDFEHDGNESYPLIPRIQKYTGGTIANSPMYSKSTTSKLEFKNICSLVKLSLTGDGILASIKVRDSEKFLSGRFTLDSYGNAVVTPSTGRHSIILDLGEGVTLSDKQQHFYIAIPSGSYSNLEFTFTDNRGKSTSIKMKEGLTRKYARSTCYSIVKTAKFINILNGKMPKAGDALKIYDGKQNNTYMYGPTIFVNEDGSIDTWWASSGGRHSPGDTLWQKSEEATRKAERIASSVTRIFGQYFETDKSFYSVFVRFATYGRTDQVCNMSIYEWKGDVQTTVNHSPIHTVRHATSSVSGRSIDNRWMPVFKNDNLSGGAITKENMLPAGKYFVTFRPADYSRDVDLAVYRYTTAVPSSDRPHKSSCWQGVYTGNNTSGSWGEMQSVQFEAAVNYSTPYLDVAFWDQIKYRHSDDGGLTWTDPEISLQPTYNARDHFSACDPSLVKIGEYYYMAYTGTETNDNYMNNIYLARSKTPMGPWEKWSWNSGKGNWGHYCDPLVSFDGAANEFGIGEPSMVYKNGSLYFYYQLVQGKNRCTKVTIINNIANDLQWPLKVYSLHEVTQPRHGVAFVQSPGFGETGSADSADIKYCESDKNFYAVFTYDRFTAASKIAIMKSSDGVNFNYIGNVAGPLVPELHNCGMSGTPEGHFSFDKPQYIGYSQGGQDSGNWGAWPSYWHALYW